jgi:hypothetical protein
MKGEGLLSVMSREKISCYCKCDVESVKLQASVHAKHENKMLCKQDAVQTWPFGLLRCIVVQGVGAFQLISPSTLFLTTPSIRSSNTKYMFSVTCG